MSAKVASVKEQIAALKAGETARTVDPATAVKLADFLRQYGSFRVVVSCVPGDLEAYAYANQLVGILKSAGWDANGPEQTANVVEGPAMGITVFDRDPSAPDAAKILLDAFKQFDIPHQVGITAEYAVPDSRDGRAVRREEAVRREHMQQAGRVHLCVDDGRSLGERAMRGIGYDAEEAAYRHRSCDRRSALRL